MNKNDNLDGDDDYYKQFDFLNKPKHPDKNEVQKEFIPPSKMKNLMTVDQQKNQGLDMNTAIKSVMEENLEMSGSESLIMRKTEGQKMMESPEMNKKLRTQIDYRQAIKAVQLPKKNIQDEITFNQNNIDFLRTKEEKNKLIYKEMKKYHLKSTETNDINDNKENKPKEIIEIKNDYIENKIPSSENSADSKLKVYKIKKTKISHNSQESTTHNEFSNNFVISKRDETITHFSKLPEEINKHNAITKNSYSKFLPYVYSSSMIVMGSYFLVKIFKKIKK
jgi:hypothetical protein